MAQQTLIGLDVGTTGLKAVALTTEGEMVAEVYEQYEFQTPRVAFGLRDSLELIRSLGAEPLSARVSGGGANGDLWVRIVASVLRLPVQRTTSSAGAAFGAALVGGVAGGVFSDVEDAVSRCVRLTDTIEPDGQWADHYDHLYGRFHMLYPTLRRLISAGEGGVVSR